MMGPIGLWERLFGRGQSSQQPAPMPRPRPALPEMLDQPGRVSEYQGIPMLNQRVSPSQAFPQGMAYGPISFPEFALHLHRRGVKDGKMIENLYTRYMMNINIQAAQRGLADGTYIPPSQWNK